MVTTHRILAIHGAGMNADAFADLSLDGLLSVTLPGHAAGDQSPCLSVAAAARHLCAAALPAQAGVVLVGHSMGAMVALRAASDPRVKAVVALGAAALMPVNADLLRLASENPAEAQAMMTKWGVFKEAPAAEAVRAKVQGIFSAVPKGVLAQDLAFCDQDKTLADILPGIAKPVLVLSGAQDKMVRAEESQKLAAVLPQATFQTLPGMGHMMMLEQPGAVSDAIAAFLSAAI